VNLPFNVLFEDNHCLVVAKSARLLVASDDTGDETLLGLLRIYNEANQAPGKKGYVAPLHFLDRPVSGVVMFAKSSKAASRLSEDFRTRRIDKVYRAVVEGCPRDPDGLYDDWLLKDKDANFVKVVGPQTPGAKPCQLRCRLLARHGPLSLLDIHPYTGRSHQIRVQLSSRGLPIFGDTKYGASRPWDGAIALHARQVTFTHPVSKDRLTVEAPLPPVWQELWPRITDVQEA
jgi:23S rRNA pseudouridine1911/1915/1917 synthase